MAFQFRLARVLRVRGQQRQLAQEDVVRTLAELSHLADQIELVRVAQQTARDAEDAAGREGRLVAADVLRWRSYEAAAQARERILERERERVGEVLERRRETLRERRREERKLERLGERARNRAEAAEARATALLLDDLALRGQRERE